MTTKKKFPTPNLDKLVYRNHMDYWPLTAAAQADIALAVEADRKSLLTFAPDLRVTIGSDVDAARVTVPDMVRETLIEAVRGEQAWGVLESEKLNAAYKWLESLTVSPKDAP